MQEANSLNRADLGFIVTQEHVARIPGLFEICSAIVTDDAQAKEVDAGSDRLEAIWEIVWQWKGGGVQSQVRGYAPGSMDELLCLRDAHYDPVLIAERSVICDIVNRAVPLCGTPISNGCHCINVQDGISFLVYRDQDKVYIMDEAYFGCEQFEELDEENEGRTVTIEEPATGTMTEVWESPHDILFVETDDNTYVICGDGASVESFSEWAWEAFCEGYNPRT